MSNTVEYSSKSVAHRGLVRMGITDKALAETLISRREDGKFLVDPDAVTEALASKQRGTLILSDADKKQITDEARDRGAVIPSVTSSASEQMTQDEIDADLAATCGYSHCPACEIHLSNGVMDYDSLVDRLGEKDARKLQTHAWSCMGCNAEWGDEIAPTSGKGRSEPLRHYTNKSTVDGAVQVVWDLCAAMPDARRKDVIAAAVEKGVAFYTARTQYQKWFKAQKSNKAK